MESNNLVNSTASRKMPLTSPHIVVVGSYATGLTMKAARIPGSGETLLGTGYRVDFGGKGSNQAVGAARLGAHVDFVAKIGADTFGEMALGLYREEGIDTKFILRTNDAPTGVGFIVVEASTGHNAIVIDPGANDLLGPVDVSSAKAAIGSAAVVLTQLETPVEAAGSALALARASGAITILNPAPVRPLPDSVLSLIDILTPNETEARILAGKPPNAHVEPESVARELMKRGVKNVVMTLGEKGALWISASGQKHVPAVPVTPVDTTGAGDSFNAGLAVALANGESIEDAIRFGTITGAMAVTKEGVIPSLPRRAEVLSFCKAHGLNLPSLARLLTS